MRYDSFQMQVAEYVSKYLLDRFSTEMTPTEVLQTYPWERVVWAWYFGMAHFGENRYYTSWDDVPDPVEDMRINIVTKEKCEGFRYHKGKWLLESQLYPSMFKR